MNLTQQNHKSNIISTFNIKFFNACQYFQISFESIYRISLTAKMKLLSSLLLCYVAFVQAQDNKPFKTRFTAAARAFSGEVYGLLASEGSGNIIYSPLR